MKYNIHIGSYLDDEYQGTFDVIVMNPPYNSPSKNKGAGHTLWDKFVIKSINQLAESGYLVAIHPDGWRGLGSGFEKVRNVLKSKQILYLEVHNTNDGVKTFGAGTTYDFYCLHNKPNTIPTKIKCQDGSIECVDISKMQFIPNGMFEEFNRLIAKDGEERVNVLRSYSYDTRKKYVAKKQTEEFKYPIVYVTYKDGSINFMYSNTKEKGHFGIPKVIWSNGGASTPIIDEQGEYGLTEFAYFIVDEPKNLPFIQKAMLHPDFLKLMSFSDGVTGVGRHRYNRKVIALFKKDWWKEFI